MPELLLNTFRTAQLQTDGLYFSNCKFKVKRLKLFIYVTSWDEISHMSQFFLMEFNTQICWAPLVLQIGENQKSISYLCSKILILKLVIAE